ncbi:MAG: YeeE/YedE family protein [Chitinophagales bacterium]|nr:YeeE/YedE family protein [Chitinophagales bacterium]
MDSIISFISQPWHWAVSGTAIALTMALMIWMGRSFGVSTSFKAICAAAGAGKRIQFFNINVKDEFWRLAFVAGGLVGGFIAGHFLESPEAVDISTSTIEYLSTMGISYPESDALGRGFVPTDLFNFSSLRGVLLALIGGFLVGFGARYGDGCTSGHAITGLSNLQLPSLITVIGFFIGGLLMTHLLFPLLMGL